MANAPLPDALQAVCCWASHGMGTTWCPTHRLQWLQQTAVKATVFSYGPFRAPSPAASCGVSQSSEL